MKRGPIPKKYHAIILEPNIRIGMLDDLKELDNRVLKIQFMLRNLADDLEVVNTDIQTLHSRIRELGSGRTTDEGRKTK